MIYFLLIKYYIRFLRWANDIHLSNATLREFKFWLMWEIDHPKIAIFTPAIDYLKKVWYTVLE